MRTGQFLPNAIPGEPVKLKVLTLSCATCGIISEMEAIGYTLPQDEEEKQVGRVRFVLQHIWGDEPLKCDCLLPSLEKLPVVGLYIPENHPEFN
jgi:hypothetical protein